jgi:E3 ubiquitin-protein ligase UBR1
MNTESPPDRVLKSFRHIAAKYALPFLRKVAILLHAQYGVEFPNTGPDSGELPEIDRLVTLLRLPSVDEVLESFGTGREGSHIEAMAAGWIHHWNRLRIGARADDNRNLVPSLSHPAIFELVGLPKFYDVLLDEANQRRCPSTGKELTDPSVCLFCGEIFCSQATCCATNSQKGGCNNHVAKYVFFLFPSSLKRCCAKLMMTDAAKTLVYSSIFGNAPCWSCTTNMECGSMPLT